MALVDLSHGYFVIRFHQEEDMMDEGLDRSPILNKPQYLVLKKKVDTVGRKQQYCIRLRFG